MSVYCPKCGGSMFKVSCQVCEAPKMSDKTLDTILLDFERKVYREDNCNTVNEAIKEAKAAIIELVLERLPRAIHDPSEFGYGYNAAIQDAREAVRSM